jgi:hypothetical protein
LFVFSDSACDAQILLLASPHGSTLLAMEFAGSGRVSPLGRVTIPTGLAPADAVAAAGSRFLESSCR